MSHREMENTEGYQNTSSVVTEAPSVRGVTEIGCLFFQRFYTQSIYFKSYQKSIHYTSVALCAIGTSVLLRLPLSSP